MISTSMSSLMEPIFGIISKFLCGVDPGIAMVCSSIALMLTLTLFLTSKPRVYLVDFSCYRPPEFHKRTREFLIGQAVSTKAFNEGSITFMKKMLERSGIGQESYVPASIIQVPHQPCMEDARAEAKQVVFGAVDELLEKSRLRVEDVGILVVNCSLFGPSPSLASIIVNHYKLREDVISHNLGGMGCSAGLISIDLANQLLQVHPNTYALVVSTENMTLNCYYGNYRPMLVTNSLFRMGCGAILLSNCRADKIYSKYELMHTVRTNIAPNDLAYGCVFQEEDEKGTIGISLSKELMVVAGEALKTNITTLGPIVLPVTEKLKFLWSMVQRKLLKMKVKAYMPDFKLAIEHFCIHAGGRAVLDAIEKNLNLSKWHMEPSRMTLWRWGNTSSSSLWYELAYTEAKGRVKKGDRLWQIAFGSGFKCNSVVWKAIRAVHPRQEKNPWMVDIDQFPVEIPTITTINT